MKPLYILCLVLLIAGCEATHEATHAEGPDYEAIARDLERSGAVQFRFGHPEGAPSTFLTTGMVSEDPEFHTADAITMRNSVAVVGMAISNLVRGSESWEEAHEAVQQFLSNPPPEAGDLPRYILPQIAAQSMAFRSDLLTTEADSPRHREVVEEYLQIFLENRFPNPVPVARMLDIVANNWSQERVATAAASALASYEMDAALHAKRNEDCPGCRVLREGGERGAFLRDEAIGHLTALSR